MKAISNSSSTTIGTDAAVRAARRVFRVPLAPRLLSLFVVIFLVGITGIMIGFAVVAFMMQWTLGLFMVACAGFIGALTGYVGRDFRGKWGLRIVLDTDAVTLDLPAGRSLIHRPPAQYLTIPILTSKQSTRASKPMAPLAWKLANVLLPNRMTLF